MLLGAHMSIAGGVDKAVERGAEIGCGAIQIFTKSNNRWDARPLKDEEVKNFFRNKEKTGIQCVIAHDSYLINIATADKPLLDKSRSALIVELERAEQLGIHYLVIHPGAHTGQGEQNGIKAIALSLKEVFHRTRHCKVVVLLETTAGQGTSIGHTFEHLREIINSVNEKNRIGVCFDTCHAFAAGYDMREEAVYKKTFSRFDNIIGLEYLKAFHLNDSKRELGSRVDRHEHIGQGYLGLEPFRLILNDERFKNIPKILETPKQPDMADDKMNLKLLRSLVKSKKE